MSLLFDSTRTETWTGNYKVMGRVFELEPAFMRRVGNKFVPIRWLDTGVVEFLLKSWFARNARSV